MAVETAGHDGGPYNFRLLDPQELPENSVKACPLMERMIMHLLLDTRELLEETSILTLSG